MRLLHFSVLLAAVVEGATLQSRSLKVFEAVQAPEDWKEIGRPSPSTKLALAVTLKAVCYIINWHDGS